MRAAAGRGAAEPAGVLFQGKERMFGPGLPDLFDPRVVVRPAAHAIKVLQNERVVGVGQGEEIQFDGALVADARAQGQTDLSAVGASLGQGRQISHDDVRSRVGAFRKVLRRGAERERE